MTTKENKLIAKFMGWECRTRKNYEDNIKVLYKPNGSIFRYSGYGYLRNKTPWDAPFQFHKSWDWLMPVVEKIENADCVSHIGWTIDLGLFVIEVETNEEIRTLESNKNHETNIQCVYNAVVKFIKWYNKKQKNE